MKTPAKLVLAIIAAFFWLPPQGARAEPAGAFIGLSDIHFDPLANPAIAAALLDAEPEDWPAIFDRSASPFSGVGEDTSWPLLRSALAQVVQEPPFDFVTLTGDLLPHRFRERFFAQFPGQGEPAFRRFVRSATAFVISRVQQSGAGRPILFTPGNNDDVCGNYQVQPDGPFLQDTLPIVRKVLPGSGSPDFAKDWTELGSYDVGHPTNPRLRVIALNTVFLSQRYRNECGASSTPGSVLLDWLAAHLHAAQAAGQKVWLLMHIPPGIDIHETLRAGCSGPVRSFWAQAYLTRFEAIVRDYMDTMVTMLAGHTHRDEFRLLGGLRDPTGSVVVVPAMSPIYGQNPAFQRVLYRPDGALAGRTTVYLADLEEAARGLTPAWKPGVTADAAGGVSGLDTPALRGVADRLATDPAALTRYLTQFATERAAFWPLPMEQGYAPPAITRAIRCAAAYSHPEPFRGCFCDPD